MSDIRYDIIYDKYDRCYPEPHFCREMDCFGYNPDHGFTWEQARKEVAKYYLDMADDWETMPENKYEGPSQY